MRLYSILFVMLLGFIASCENDCLYGKIKLHVKSTESCDEFYCIDVSNGHLYVKTQMIDVLTLDTIIKDDSLLLSVSDQNELSRLARKVLDGRETDSKGFVHDGIMCLLQVNSHKDKFFPYGDSIKMTPQWNLYQFLMKKAPFKMELHTGT